MPDPKKTLIETPKICPYLI